MSFSDTAHQLEATDRLLTQAGELAAHGRFAEAEKLYQESLKHIVNLYGARSLKACSCLLDLADIYYHNEQYAEVITLLEQVLVTNQSEEIFADEKLLSIKFKLGRALEKSGNLRQAGQCYAEVLNEANIICGPVSPFTKTVAECVRSLAKRTGAVPHVESLDSKLGQIQTGQFTQQGTARTQYDTSQLERLRQSTSMNLPEAAPVNTEASDAHL
jgi:tetratricopeptide (TPR) repeat protein